MTTYIITIAVTVIASNGLWAFLQFLITGANGADIPLFSEIEAGGKKFFVIGSNYCVEM